MSRCPGTPSHCASACATSSDSGQTVGERTMLRRLGFVLALGTAVSLVGTLQAQQRMMSPINARHGGSAAGRADSHRRRIGGSAGSGIITATNAGPSRSSPAIGPAVIVPFQIMADNAWQRQNLLSRLPFCRRDDRAEQRRQVSAAVDHRQGAAATAGGLRRTLAERQGDDRTDRGRAERPLCALAPDYAAAAGLRIEPGPRRLDGRGRRRDAA